MALGGANFNGSRAVNRDVARGGEIADAGTRYQSKLYNPAFLREKNPPVDGLGLVRKHVADFALLTGRRDGEWVIRE